jgi:hypothetical protein
VDKPVEDGVDAGGVADEGVPVGDANLACDRGGAPAVAVFENLQEVLPGLCPEGLEAPVVEDEEVGGA